MAKDVYNSDDDDEATDDELKSVFYFGVAVAVILLCIAVGIFFILV